MILNDVKMIYAKGAHNAFTDLIYFKGQRYCAFRTAQTHNSADGTIVVLTLDDIGMASHETQLFIKGADLRDPKLSVTPSQQLLLLAYGRYVDHNGKHQFSQPVIWHCDDGASWSGPTSVGDKHWWLWRLRWYEGIAYGLAYHKASQSLRLYAGTLETGFGVKSPQALSLDQHGWGYPNEHDLCFDNERAYALVRRDADSCTALLGSAKPPYDDWHWHDTGIYVGAPCMIRLDSDTSIVAGRSWQQDQPKTSIWTVDLRQGALTQRLTLPSGGDNSYPGMILDTQKGELLLSYYSSHEKDGKSRIYLATICLGV